MLALATPTEMSQPEAREKHAYCGASALKLVCFFAVRLCLAAWDQTQTQPVVTMAGAFVETLMQKAYGLEKDVGNVFYLNDKYPLQPHLPESWADGVRSLATVSAFSQG